MKKSIENLNILKSQTLEPQQLNLLKGGGVILVTTNTDAKNN